MSRFASNDCCETTKIERGRYKRRALSLQSTKIQFLSSLWHAAPFLKAADLIISRGSLLSHERTVSRPAETLWLRNDVVPTAGAIRTINPLDKSKLIEARRLVVVVVATRSPNRSRPSNHLRCWSGIVLGRDALEIVTGFLRRVSGARRFRSHVTSVLSSAYDTYQSRYRAYIITAAILNRARKLSRATRRGYFPDQLKWFQINNRSSFGQTCIWKPFVLPRFSCVCVCVRIFLTKTCARNDLEKYSRNKNL